MKAKMAIQQKMYRENSWGDGKQRLEELFKLTFFDKFAQTVWLKVVWNSSVADNCFELITWAVQVDDNLFRAG